MRLDTEPRIVRTTKEQKRTFAADHHEQLYRQWLEGSTAAVFPRSGAATQNVLLYLPAKPRLRGVRRSSKCVVILQDATRLTDHAACARLSNQPHQSGVQGTTHKVLGLAQVTPSAAPATGTTAGVCKTAVATPVCDGPRPSQTSHSCRVASGVATAVRLMNLYGSRTRPQRRYRMASLIAKSRPKARKKADHSFRSAAHCARRSRTLLPLHR